MAKSRDSAKVGDTKSPALQPTRAGLQTASDQAFQIEANSSHPLSRASEFGNLAASLKAVDVQSKAPLTCRQKLWFSCFFDGTGNNLDADLRMKKHSNIARLFRVRKETGVGKGVFAVYIPGVGTYFPEIGDDGGSPLGLGCGAMGEKRLYFALDQFDRFLARPLALAHAPASAIDEINVAIFGFSRGAALARAFANLLMESRCALHGEKWALKAGGWPVRFRLLGLFDTVASVGQPLSSNTTGFVETLRGDVSGMISKRLNKYHDTRPQELAFHSKGAPGADPAPGSAAGHNDWGGKLKIHEAVEEVRHFVAAHEIRNSFPLDSVSVLSSGKAGKPSNFFEIVYPGSHSDVGGSYAPGEGGRALLPNENLGRIPLHHMYDYAVRQGVPLLAKTAWKPENKDDFDVSTQLADDYNYYMKKLGSSGSLGIAINRNAELYLAWRFRSIKRKMVGDRSEASLIHFYDAQFRQDEAALNMEIATLTKKDQLASLHLETLMELKEEQASRFDETANENDLAIENARKNCQIVHDELLKLKARKDSLPDMKNLQAMLDLYDRQLLADARAVRGASEPAAGSSRSQKINDLRPHYRVLLEAFENEFVRAKGLNDERIVRFFDNYVHDSLAGFAKDATLPSDPRVVYLGGDEKFRYASRESQDLASGTETGIV